MTNSVIGALRVVLGMDTAQFDKDAGRAKAKANALGSALKSGLAIAAGAAAAAAGALGIAIKGAINDADDMSKAAAKLGIPIGELSQMRYAADLSGVSMEGLSTSVKKLSTTLNDAKNGSKSAVEALGQIGIKATDASGNLKSSSAVIGEVADRFAMMPDGVEKSAIAVKLFGRAGLDMIPMLNGGSEALREMMAEADALGLTLTAETGKAAEQFNDNLSRISYAGQGVVTQLTATLAPALAVVSDGLVTAARGAVGFLQHLPQIAEYAAVAGGALALTFGPTILASVGAMTVAIGTGLVGAVRLLGVAIAANPLGALALGIAASIVAVYHFRDEIQKAIGVDVVQIAKDAGNFIINSFEAAYEDVKFVWNQLPNAMGAAAVGAANVTISEIAKMVNAAVEGINSVIAAIPTWLGGGGNGIDFRMDEGDRWKNTYAEELKKAVGDRNANVDLIMGQDRISQLGKAFEASIPAVQNFGAAVDGVLGGGEGGKVGKAAKEAAAALKKMQMEGKSVFEATRTPLERYQIELQRLSELLKAGAIDQDTYARAVKAAKDNLDQAKNSMAGLGNIGAMVGDAFKGLVDGTKTLKETLLDMLSSVASQLMNSSLSSLFGGLGGIFGGIFGGTTSAPSWLNNGFDVPGFARGGTILPGGAGGGIDSQLVMFRKSPNERVDITKPGQTLDSGRGGVADVRVYVDQDGNWQAEVERIAYEQASGVTSAGITAYDGRLPDRIAQVNRNPSRR